MAVIQAEGWSHSGNAGPPPPADPGPSPVPERQPFSGPRSHEAGRVWGSRRSTPGRAWQAEDLGRDKASAQRPPSHRLSLEPHYNHTSPEHQDSTAICLQDLFMSCKN